MTTRRLGRIRTVLIAATVCLAGAHSLRANPVAEFGTTTASQSNSAQWHAVNFTKTYSAPPVVIVGPLSSAGLDPSTVRVRNVTATGFEWQIDEFDYRDGGHTTETVSYLVMEEGVHDVNGQIFEVGRASIGANFSAVTLAGIHPSAPIVLSQVETANNMLDATDTVAVVTRTRNVSTAGFELRLQDQESNTIALAQESVGYISVTSGSGYLDGRPFTVLTTGDVLTDDYLTVDFGVTLPSPGILASQQTADGGDTCSIRYDNPTDTSVDLWLEEETSNDSEIGHTTENASLLIFGAPYDEDDAKLDIFTITANGNWKTINLTQTYDNPVVVIGPPTYVGPDNSTVRVRNVTADSFEVQIDEWDYRDGGHATETMGVAVMEAGIYEIGGLKWIANAREGVTNAQAAVAFPDPFDEIPIVLGQVVTTNEPEAVVHQIRSLDNAGFTVKVDEEKANDRVHGEETFHYVAIEGGEGSFSTTGGVLFSVATTANTINHEDELIDFGANYALPIFVADFQTTNGGDPSALRLKNLTAGSALVFLEEEDSTGDGTDHTNEVVGYLVASTAVDTDGDGIGDDWENLYSLNPNDPSDADADPDNDLLTNLEEYEAGYDPFNFSGGRITLSTIASDAFEKEGTRARFRVNRTVGKAAVSVDFQVGPGSDPDTGTSGSDYVVTLADGTVLNDSVTVPVGATQIDIYVDPVDDSVHEFPEDFSVSLLDNPDYIKAGSNQSGTISDATDDPDNDKLYVGLYQAEPWAQGQTSASGYATLLVNGSNTQAKVGSSFSGLTTPQTVAHIHRAEPSAPTGQAGPIVIGVPNGQLSGEIWDIGPSAGFSGRELIDSLNKQDGLFLYVNVHTSQFPSGEIRAVLGLVENPGDEWSAPPAPPAITPLSGDDLTRDVARFLTQATFGPTQQEIEDLVDDIENNHSGNRIAGFSQWITDQLALDQTNLYDYTFAADTQEWSLRGTDPITHTQNNEPNQNNRRRGWWTIATGSHDQLRQRVGFALSEIFVVSENDNLVRIRHYGAAKYYDMLVDHADGNFRDILEDVSKHPIMGAYLSHLKNQKAIVDPQTGDVLVAPDENYAREIMQLFSIGLLHLNPDGTLSLDSEGLPQQTYTNDDITELARVFTGWSFSKGHGSLGDGYPEIDNNNFNRGNGPQYFQASWENPMKNFSAYHDTDEKNFLGATVSAGLDGEADLDAALDIIHNHPNTGPFIARLLIQRLTHSNPSRGYIYRVAQAFENGTHNGSGSGQRGDIEAAVRAVLLDHEARTLSLADDVGFGKQKEPIIRYTQVLRALGAYSEIPLSDLSSWGYPAGQLDNFPTGQSRLRYGDTNTSLSQSPLKAPTVFNWFLPDYEPGGDISSAGLFAPEMIQTTETQVIYALNFFHNITRGTWQGGNPLIGETNPDLDNIRIDRSELQALYDAEITGGATVEEAVETLIDHLDVLLMAGNFKAVYDGAPPPNPRSLLIDLIASQSNNWKIRDALYMMITTPEYIHQK